MCRADLYRTAIVPIGVAFALVLWLGNAAYLYLSVSFIQMIKAPHAAVGALRSLSQA